MQDIDFVYLFTSTEGRINRQRWWIGVAGLLVIWLVSALLFGRDGLVAFIIGLQMLHVAVVGLDT